MTQAETAREKAIQVVADMMRRRPFQIIYRVKKRPAGIKIIYELTQREMNAIFEREGQRQDTSDEPCQTQET